MRGSSAYLLIAILCSGAALAFALHWLLSRRKSLEMQRRLSTLDEGLQRKNKIALRFRYFLAGMEFGLIYQYITGDFKPDFGDGYVPQEADENIENTFGFPVGSPGFSGRFGGWNSLLTRDFTHQRLKAL